MKKVLISILSVLLVLSLVGCSTSKPADKPEGGDAEAIYTAGTYKGVGTGFGGTLEVEVTVSDTAIEKIEIVSDSETEGRAETDEAKEKVIEAIIAGGSAEVDGVSGATMTSDAIKEAVAAALAEAAGGAAATPTDAGEPGELSFTPGTYNRTGDGYNGPVEVSVTFTENAIEDIEVVSTLETKHVGDVCYDILKEDIIAANGVNVDSVSGATFSSMAYKNAVAAAAEAAGADMNVFKTNTFVHEPGEPIEDSWDVVVVGAGGAGVAAAAQASQNGDSVLIIETNAEIGGNTLVSGGQYQSVMKYLVWDPEDPDATTGTRFDGETFEKTKAVAGQLAQLKGYLEWSEEPFDEEYYKTNEFVAGDEEELMKHGVHPEYLPVLQDLKKEIKEYVDWADAKIAAGTPETELTLFSTENLHIFQTYYGGLRPTADGSEWEYGDVDLVTQMVHDGQDIKPWLMSMSEPAEFIESQLTLIGALWYRENDFVRPKAQWETYFMPMMSAVNEGSEKNEVMLRTTAKSLIVEDGKVVGVEAEKFDGTKVTARANKGVVLATGGYAANVEEVVATNKYWSDEYLSASTKTTNRSSIQGDGIEMGKEAGGDVTGMNFTQLMPISWIDNGNLAFGGGNYAVWINPTTGERFVNETAERDVLSLAEFKNGVEMLGAKGVFVEIANAKNAIPGPYPYGSPTAEEGSYGAEMWMTDVENRQYLRKVSEIPELLKELGFEADGEKVLETIRNYDDALINNPSVMTDEAAFGQVIKRNPSNPIGDIEKNEDGTYNLDTYNLDDAVVRVRLMAPSTHHTMGGLKVDLDRHVLDADGNIVPGLYAAGEVTGGIHGGNRLGGNAIVEIIISGRAAANGIAKDNQ